MQSAQCSQCKRFFHLADKAACHAFPEGIPFEIQAGDFDHTEKHPDQENSDLLFVKEDLPFIV
ncbi:MAG: hypothetical protein JRJ54_07215 [Deltaproteobacteria bacterium]|nr:hypothetical protein [Deltaproteobacteria bacterium]